MNFFEEKKHVRIVSLENWLDWTGGKRSDVFVALPMIQRGSVWKPHQIIDLWDSLLQGMPIGGLMASELKPFTLVRRFGQNKSEEISIDGGLGLIDGQQRTLAMLAGWPLADDIKMDRRIWVDFADDPIPGQFLRLRVTTVNQPFGFRTDEPSKKLSLNDRRKAQDLHRVLNETKSSKDDPVKPTLENAWPYTSKPSIPIDLRWLISKWRENKEAGNDPMLWESVVWDEITKIKSERNSLQVSQSDHAIKKNWPIVATIQERISGLKEALHRLFEMEIPLIRVDDRFFDVDESKDSDPPLALLFKRIGTGGTKLSDADYVYSTIKHLRPETYDLVESLYEPRNGRRNVSSLLTATDLVMSAVRLAAAGWKEQSVPDRENPSKQDFLKLLRRGNGEFLTKRFLPLIEVRDGETEESLIVQYFSHVQDCLEYKGDGDIGLPRHMFPYLGRPLVQVLLRLAQVGYLANITIERRQDILRLVLFWILSVNDHGKASELAYKVILDKDGTDDLIGYAIHKELIDRKVSLRIVDPKIIQDRPQLAFSLDPKKLCNYSRFEPTSEDEKLYSDVYDLYRRWWRPWTFHHPMLLWLQRGYVAKKEKETWTDPMAGRDDDTPYDYDHILPSSNWDDWRGPSGRPPSFSGGNIGIIGNGIGNVRIWDSSNNREDGDEAPQYKLKLTPKPDNGSSKEEPPIMAELLSWSAIPERHMHNEQIEAWIGCSPNINKRYWDETRTAAFQSAVELRTFYLYEHFYNELGYSAWLIVDTNK